MSEKKEIVDTVDNIELKKAVKKSEKIVNSEIVDEKKSKSKSEKESQVKEIVKEKSSKENQKTVKEKSASETVIKEPKKEIEEIKEAKNTEQTEQKETREREFDRLRRFRRPSGRKKVCSFCVDKVTHIDYKDVAKIKHFVTEKGKILPRRQTGTCSKHQRMLASAVKKARIMALLPFRAL